MRLELHELSKVLEEGVQGRRRRDRTQRAHAPRHSILSRLAEVLTPHELQSWSQHRDLDSLAHYTTGVRPNQAAVVRAIRPKPEE